MQLGGRTPDARALLTDLFEKVFLPACRDYFTCVVVAHRSCVRWRLAIGSTSREARHGDAHVLAQFVLTTLGFFSDGKGGLVTPHSHGAALIANSGQLRQAC